jgi:hypothetical protein
MTKFSCTATSVLVLLCCGIAVAQDAPAATAPAKTFEDASLKWGPCPSFLPDGCSIAVLHGDPAQPNADIFFKVPGKSKIARHWHTSAERMVLVSGELQVTYDGRSQRCSRRVPMPTVPRSCRTKRPARARLRAC